MRKLFCIMVLISGSQALADKARGGGSPIMVDEQVIRLIIEGETLKNSVSNYFKTIKVEEIENPEVRQMVPRLLSEGLLRDVKSADNYYFGDCLDAQDSSVPASTEFGQMDGNQCKPNIGGRICFNPKKLVSIYESEGLSEEQLLIRLAALAIHEHIHHFQCVNDKNEMKLESEANQVAAYVQLSARLVQIPLLKWVSPNSKSDLKAVIAELQKVQIEKTQLVVALKHAQTVKTTAIVIGVSSALVTVAWPFVTQRGLRMTFGKYESWEIYKAVNELISNALTPLAGVTTAAVSSGVAGYYYFKSHQYQAAIEDLQKDIDRINGQISTLIGAQ